MVVLESTEAVARAESSQASMGENAEALIARGNQHFVEDDFDRALQCYTHAIELEPQNAAAFVHRAATYLKLERYQDAFDDADKSTQIDPSVAKAHLRKGMAAFHLGQFKAAKACFAIGYELDPQVSTYKMWMRKCDAEIEEMGGDGDVGQDNHATPMVEDDGIAPAAPVGSQPPAENGSSLAKHPQALASGTSAATPAAPAPTVAPPPKYRLDWYQNAKEVILAVLAKGLTSEDVQVFYNTDQLGVDISRAGAHDCSIRLHLCGQIVPSECSHSVTKNKIEIKLRKAEPAQWGGLEAGKAITKVSAAAAAAPVAPAEATHLPAYPTSRKKPVDWDQLEAKIKLEEKDEKLEGDAALNKLFQDIYANADEDTRRAMNKSFQESNGTVLSTNWADVGKKKVEGHPPSGMELKHYD